MKLDTYYSPEVEEALVTLLWHKPELLPRVLRQIDPTVHIMQEHLRFILEAVQLSQDLLNATDFVTVVQALKEDGRFEACGELVGLDAIYSRNYGYESLLDYYIELLKLYATKREQQAPDNIVLFSGGKGTIRFQEKSDPLSKEPDGNGLGLIRGRKYRIVARRDHTDPNEVHLSFYAA